MTRYQLDNNIGCSCSCVAWKVPFRKVLKVDRTSVPLLKVLFWIWCNIGLGTIGSFKITRPRHFWGTGIHEKFAETNKMHVLAWEGFQRWHNSCIQKFHWNDLTSLVRFLKKILRYGEVMVWKVQYCEWQYDISLEKLWKMVCGKHESLGEL